VVAGALARRHDVDAVVAGRGLAVVSDDSSLLAAIDEALAAQPDVAEKIRGGKVQAAGAIVGAVMKTTRGQADAAKVRARESAFFAAKEALGRNSLASAGRLPVSITWVAPNRIRRDLDGLLCAEKPRLDGIAAALGIDDSQFRPMTLDGALDVEKKGFVLVEIGR